METMKLIASAAVVFCVHIAVRVSRAVESALWELCPEVIRGYRRVADSAHKALNAAQRPGDKLAPAPAPAYAEVLTPPPAPTAGRFTSPRAWDAACKAYEQRANELLDARSAAELYSAEWHAFDRQFKNNSAAWKRCNEMQPSAADYRREREELDARPWAELYKECGVS